MVTDELRTYCRYGGLQIDLDYDANIPREVLYVCVVLPTYCST